MCCIASWNLLKYSWGKKFTLVIWTLQASIQQLRERLSRALGQQPAAPAAPAAPVQTQRARPQQPAPTQAMPQHMFQPAMVPQPAATAAPMPIPTPAQQQYYQPVCSSELLPLKTSMYKSHSNHMVKCSSPLCWSFH